MRTLISWALGDLMGKGRHRTECWIAYWSSRKESTWARNPSPVTNTVPRDSQHSALLPVSGRIWKVFVTAAIPPAISSVSLAGLPCPCPCPCPCLPCFLSASNPNLIYLLLGPLPTWGLCLTLNLLIALQKGERCW